MWAAHAAGFEAHRWTAADRAAMQALLEFERTDEPRRLPESGAVFTIEQTVLRPRVCRRFTVTPPGGAAQTATACRTGPQQWALGHAAPAILGSVATTERPSTAITDRPRDPALGQPPLPGRRPAVRAASATGAVPPPAFASLVPPRHPNAGDTPPWRSPLPRTKPRSAL